MKKSNLAVLFVLMILSSSSAMAQADTLYIRTSAQCGTCKRKLERDMSFERGVKKVSLDLDTKQLMVVFQPSKTDPSLLRKAVTVIGYDADSLTALPEAYERLPACCKRGGHGH